MSDRITRSDLTAMTRRYVRACVAVGAIQPGDRVHLSIGSKTYGRAYRVHLIPNGQNGHHNPPIGPDYLGMTAPDAYDTLGTICRTAEDVAWRCLPINPVPYLTDEEASTYIA